MRYTPEQIVTSGDMSEATVTSTTFDLQQVFAYSVQAVWTGSPVGTFTLQASNDNSNWSTIANSSQAAGGSANSYIWNVTSSNYHYVQLLYTKTSGTGTLNAYIFSRGF